ncbi:MAG TPA: MFS transporter [Steroidobacteraceae bacterium]|nr:MFS transporter [Steroidobacteraceae bacterium]
MRAPPEVCAPDVDPTVAAPARWMWVVLVLAVCHAAAVASFQILSVLVSPIKAALQVSDVQYSLMQGLAVAIFASLLGVPAAIIADRGNRRLVVLVGVVVWVAASLACAFARNFAELFTARMMVGLGEVFLYPSALSMIADVAPPGRLSSAIGAFGCGGPVGAAFALIGGGWLLRNGARLGFIFGNLPPWRAVFLICGAFGALAAALLLTVSEPAHRAAADPRRPGIAATLSYMLRHGRLYAGVSGGMLALSFCVYATASWAPTMLVRDHAMTYSRAGAITGAAALVGGMLGAWACGLLSDWIESRGRDDAALQVASGIALAFLVAVPAAVLARSQGWTAAWIWAGYALLGMPTVVGGTALQQISPASMRAQVMAIQVLLVNLVALSLGPLAVAALSDQAFGDPGAVGYALAITVGVGALAAVVGFIASRREFVGHRARAGISP